MSSGALIALDDWCSTIPRTAGPSTACRGERLLGIVGRGVAGGGAEAPQPDAVRRGGLGLLDALRRQAVDSFGLRTRITSIDPAPRQEVDRACDEVVRSPLEGRSTCHVRRPRRR